MATTSRRVRPTLAQRLKDPALRAKLPTSNLTPKQQQQRRINQRIGRENASPLYNPAVPLAGHDLVKAAGQMTAAQLDPQIGALDRQSAQTQAQSQALVGNAGSYYRQVAQREADNVTRQRALGAALQAQLGNVAAGTQADFDHQAAAEQQRQQADAAVRGVSTPSDQVAGELTALRGRSDAMSQAAQTEGAQQSDNWANLQNALSEAMALKGQEEVGRLSNREANQLAEITGKRSDLEASRGPATAKNLGDLRQQGFENIATTQGLGLKASDLAAQIQKAKGDQRIASQRIKSAAATNAANRASRDANAAAGRDVTKRGQDLSHQDRTAAQQAADRKRIQDVRAKAKKAWAPVEDALSLIRSGNAVTITKNGQPVYDQQGQPVTRPATTLETRSALDHAGIPQWAIQAAVSIYHHGIVIPSVVQLIHSTAPDARIPTKYRSSAGRLVNYPH